MGVWDSVLAGQASGQGASDDTAPQYMDLMTALKAKLQGAKLPQDPMERLKVGLRIGQQLKQENENPQAPAPTDDNRVPAAVQNQPASDDIGAAAQPTVPSLSSLPRNLASRVKGMQVASPLASTIPDQYAGYRSSLEDEQGKADNVQAAADAYKGIPQQLDLSPIAAQVDAWTGSKLLGGYKKPESPEERAATLAKLQSMAAGAQQSVTADQLKGLLGSDHTSELLQNRLLASAMTASKNSDQPGGLDPKLRYKMMTDFNNGMDTYSHATGANGMLAQTKVRTSKAIALLNSIPNGALSSQESAELATNFANVLTGNTRVPIELIKEFIPKTGAKDATGLWQYLTGHPQDSLTQQFTQRMANSLHNERSIAEQQIHAIRLRHIAPFKQLWEADPQSVIDMADQHGVDVNDIVQTFSKGKDRRKFTEELPDGSNQPGFYHDVITGKNPAKAPAGTPGVPPKAKTVIQNGHTYTLNPVTGKYE